MLSGIKIKSIMIISSFLFIIGCSNPTNTNKMDYSKDSLVIVWRADSTGFDKGKTSANLDSLFKKYNMQDLTCKEIIDILGQPIEKVNDFISCNDFRYYVNGYYWDENGDGRIDSTREYMKQVVYFTFFNGKWQLLYST